MLFWGNEIQIKWNRFPYLCPPLPQMRDGHNRNPIPIHAKKEPRLGYCDGKLKRSFFVVYKMNI